VRDDVNPDRPGLGGARSARAHYGRLREAQVTYLPRLRWQLEMHHRAFRMVAARAFEDAHIVSRRMGLNACKHHHRSAFGA
jgi:hypothetical protein